MESDGLSSNVNRGDATSPWVESWWSADELEQAARRRLPAPVFDFVAGGAGDERTLRANRLRFDQWVLKPRVLRGITQLDTSRSVLGTLLAAAPVFVAPMSRQVWADPSGDIACAAAAKSARVGFISSMGSSMAVEDVGSAAPGGSWLQLYWLEGRENTLLSLIDRAARCGFTSVCVTVDSPTLGDRRRDLMHRSLGNGPPAPVLSNLEESKQDGVRPSGAGSSFNWKDVERLCAASSLPVALKGILSPEDAKQAIDAGVQGVYVSNHGGRQLDCCIATIDALPAVVRAVAGRVPVMVDGGVRRATDIAVALALGADAVAIGRPVWWALAVGGQRGVEEYFSALADAFRRTMIFLGVGSIEALDSSYVCRLDGTS